ncbi:glyoxylate reductase/hydroxypyruvate reductase-like [Condylostylus longicornis]|uniref:glyoxylate reductase/hydroxypyruvate reductase-like n=1 Tax=Condylostylus longicornis TaxID=2530218 RepID=UPI00244E2A0A|nr:glyoxylate reductase/hydroxypyruvate reductase-like [Condylostylus longicornis]
MNLDNSKPNVFVTRPDFPEVGINILKEKCLITTWNNSSVIPKEELLKHVVGKQAIFCYSANKIDAEVLEAAGPYLKVIGTFSVGCDHINLKECQKRGIRVGYTPDVLTDATAELTMALLLATTRRLIEANKQVYTGGWSSWSPKWMCGPGLKDSVIGIFGFGRIGQEVAKRCVPFKPKQILYTSRTEKEVAEEIGAKYVEFKVLVTSSDIVIACCPLNDETRNIFNKNVFTNMKKSVVFINSSRGGVVDQEDLYNALKNGNIYAAGLDVTTPEPLQLDDPILTLPNIVISPHIGSANIATRNDMSIVTAKNIVLGLQGQEMISEVK